MAPRRHNQTRRQNRKKQKKSTRRLSSRKQRGGVWGLGCMGKKSCPVAPYENQRPTVTTTNTKNNTGSSTGLVNTSTSMSPHSTGSQSTSPTSRTASPSSVSLSIPLYHKDYDEKDIYFLRNMILFQNKETYEKTDSRQKENISAKLRNIQQCLMAFDPEYLELLEPNFDDTIKSVEGTVRCTIRYAQESYNKTPEYFFDEMKNIFFKFIDLALFYSKEAQDARTLLYSKQEQEARNSLSEQNASGETNTYKIGNFTISRRESLEYNEAEILEQFQNKLIDLASRFNTFLKDIAIPESLKYNVARS